MEEKLKKLSAVLLIALTAVCLVPQAGAATIGLKGGLNIANMAIKTTSTDLPDFKNQTGLVGGIYVNFKLGPVSIQPEVLYSRRGLSYEEFSDETVDVTGRMLTDYIEVPVLVKYSFLAGPAKPFICAGPSVAMLLKAQQGYDVDVLTGDEPDYRSYYEVTDYFKKTAIAGVFGAGVDIKLPKVILSLEGRYHLGLTDIGEPEFMAESEITSVKHKGFSILVGIGF